jgi:hypothetical protein
MRNGLGDRGINHKLSQIKIRVIMVIRIEKEYDKKKVNTLIKQLKPSKVFDAKKFAGKIKWEEDPVEYQKRIRNEWNQGAL